MFAEGIGIALSLAKLVSKLLMTRGSDGLGASGRKEFLCGA
jgi:hypothetical protein